MGFFDFFKNKQDSAKDIRSGSISSLPTNIQEIITTAEVGLACAKNEDWRLEQKSLFRMYNLVQTSCSQILHIPNDKYNAIGSAFSLLLSYPQIRENEDLARAIADYAFYCLTKAIETNPNNKILHIKRLSMLAETRDFFYYTIANAMELPDYNPFDPLASMPLIVQTNTFLYAIVKYDLTFISDKNFDGHLGKLIAAANCDTFSKTTDGETYINKIMNYLNNTFMKY